MEIRKPYEIGWEESVLIIGLFFLCYALYEITTRLIDKRNKK